MIHCILCGIEQKHSKFLDCGAEMESAGTDMAIDLKDVAHIWIRRGSGIEKEFKGVR